MSIGKLPKRCFYAKFKIWFLMDQYIFIYLPKYLRSVFAQFKCEILQIRVETGGHK